MSFPSRITVCLAYPALKNAVEAVNNGANAYVLKPPNMKEILDTIKEQLRKQREERAFSEEKIATFIQQRILEIENERDA